LADAVEVQFFQLAEEIIRQPPRLGEQGSPPQLVAPIRLPDFPVRRSQRSDHSRLPSERCSRGSCTTSGVIIVNC